jgi:oxalate---CoA ligase
MLDVCALPAFQARRRGSAAPAGTALLVHTSGTTGAGKLVPLKASGLAYAARSVAATLGLAAGDRCLTALPLHHTHGLVGAVLSSLSAGGSAICLPGYADDAVTCALTTLAPTWYTAVPAIHARVASLAEAGRLHGHRLRFTRSASAPLTGQLLDRLRTALGVPVLQAYALTEAPGQICGHRPHETVHSGSVGRAYGCEVAVDGAGQVLVRGPHVCPGYLGAVDGELVPHRAGWLHTGDLGRLTDDGELYLVGRMDDVVNRAGEKVSPEEVEQVLAGCPGVDDIVVFGAPDSVLGQRIVAHVTGTAGPADVSGYAARVLSPGRRPDRVVSVERIPRSTTGKLNRSQLTDVLPMTEAPSHPIDAVAEIWAHVLFLPDVDPDVDFTELGGGSLQAARIEALVAERLGVELPPAAVLHQRFDGTADGRADRVSRPVGAGAGTTRAARVRPPHRG